ncbi:MAG: hypothetical protein PW790_03040 [Parvibaculaceae bacterium]|nr:hypothetical protein [Parvibaculaceae bacterium]
MRIFISLLTFFLATVLLPASSAVAAGNCADTASARPALERIETVMAAGRYISYQPTSLQVIKGQPTQADEKSIEADLKVLRPRFDGIITYGSLNGAERIPDVAAKLGYRSVIMGVWDVTNAQERKNVIEAARRQPQIVDGVSMGNEVVFGNRASYKDIADAMASFRAAAPGLAVSTTEPFHMFLQPGADLMFPQMDFLLANVHPVFESWFRTAPDANAAEFVTNVVDKLAGVYCGPVLVKETGVPTAPAGEGYVPLRQASFYVALAQRFKPERMRAFAYFSAFDAPWRAEDSGPVPGYHPEEAHWGLYDAERWPKLVVSKIPLLPEEPEK